MRIIVTNDDGFENSGIWALVNAVKDLGEVTVVAPAENQSGVGAAISFRHSIKINPAPSRVQGVTCYAVSGTPADSVILASKHIFNDDVDLVVSGINPGFNSSRNMFISGTFGASIVASALGIKTCAFSMDAEDDINDSQVNSVITAITRELASVDTPQGSLFNVNFPTLPSSGLKGAEGAAPAPSDLKMFLEAHADGGYEVFSGLKIRIDDIKLTPGTDVEVLDRGKVAITAVDGTTLNYLHDDPSLNRMIDAVNRVIG
ncbi:MAG: 5'/3'-nucleotidase SurE [Chloroflexi bacterium]|nr:5'/3'-nucleotidase SurE [Chloroflexota bacterium]